jgi:iron complex outermembrane receptor protein
MKKFTVIFYINTISLLIFLCLSYTAKSDQNQENAPRALIQQLKNLGLEELIEVETFNPKAGLAARKVQKLTDTAAALFVLTQEDIRRSGMTNLSEILRMVPGMQVARLDPHQWAISARGLNEQFASRLLVMVDGRTVYSPMRSEVNWDTQDLLLEDIERIEVIRGPGASLWGANAVNGIINIITKSAKDTQGNMLSSYVGSGEERSIVGVRHGGELNNGGHYRIYGKSHNHDSFTELKTGKEHGNEWAINQGGFRADWKQGSRDDVHLQGNVYQGSTEKSVFDMLSISDTSMNGSNVLARWQRNVDNGEIILQTYYDKTTRDEFSYNEKRDTYDIDFQHRFLTHHGHELIWGLGFRYNSDEIETEFPFFHYNPSERQDKLFSAFIQTEFMLSTDWRLTVGSKFEHNDYSGFEIQPTTRLLWNLKDKHILWGAVSRAVRTPSRTEEDLSIHITRGSPFGQNIEYLKDFQLNVLGNKNLESEVLEAYELGYRYNISNKLLLDASVFYNEYDKMRTVETIDFQAFPVPTISQQFKNQMKGEVFGLELASHWRAKDYWKFITTYSYLNTQLHIKTGSVDGSAEILEGYSPTHQVSLRSLINLNSKMELDTALYYVDDLRAQAVSNYTRFDIRLGWHFNNLELNLGVRNLFDSKHNEFSFGERGAPILLNEIPRSFYLGLRYDF